MIILGSSYICLSDLVTIFMIMMPFHKISTPTGATAPVQKVKEISSTALRIETENAKVANFEFPPPQLIQATFSEGKTE